MSPASTCAGVSYRPLGAQDEAHVWRALQLASHEESLEAVRAQPLLAMYAQGWGREGDGGVLALHGEQAIGAAWFRLWSGEARGFGFVDERTPELGIAVEPAWRGRGVGRELMRRVLSEASLSFSAISLSVRAESAAVRLYEQCGFELVAGSEIANRVGGVSFTMRRALGS